MPSSSSFVQWSPIYWQGKKRWVPVTSIESDYRVIKWAHIKNSFKSSNVFNDTVIFERYQVGG